MLSKASRARRDGAHSVELSENPQSIEGRRRESWQMEQGMESFILFILCFQLTFRWFISYAAVFIFQLTFTPCIFRQQEIRVILIRSFFCTFRLQLIFRSFISDRSYIEVSGHSRVFHFQIVLYTQLRIYSQFASSARRYQNPFH